MSADELLSVDERSGWECRFCSEKLKQQPLAGWSRLLWIVPVRPFRCPHCFNTFQKPAAFVAAIPFVGRLFCEKRGVAASVSGIFSGRVRRKRSSQRNYVNAGWFVRFARWTVSAETKTVDLFGRVFRTVIRKVLWPFHRFSKKFLRSKHNRLPPYRSKSRKRHRSRRDGQT
jgi:hypothetical protein